LQQSEELRDATADPSIKPTLPEQGVKGHMVAMVLVLTAVEKAIVSTTD
jgi:hypothetical protein